MPAESEIVLEGRMMTDETVVEGPFGEFVGYLAPADQAPMFEITAVTHRTKPIYHAINGYGRETIMLRKYVLEASLLKVLQSAVPIVTDAEMTAGGLHRFHAIVQVKKTGPHPRRPAAQRHPGVVRRAQGPRPGDRGGRRHRHPRSGRRRIRARHPHGGVARHRHGAGRARPRIRPRRRNGGIRTKLGIDATVPFAEKARFARCEFKPVEIDAQGDDGRPGGGKEAIGFVSDGLSALHLPIGRGRIAKRSG